MITLTNIETDIPLTVATRAYDGVSFSPEKRAESVIADYVKVLTSLAEHIIENAKNELVSIRYVATHEFMGQTVTDHDVCEATIARGAA